MSAVTVRCAACQRVTTVDDGYASWELGRGYLPGHYTAETCFVCRPDLNRPASVVPRLTDQRETP